MTIIRDIFDLKKDIEDFTPQYDKLLKDRTRGSIAREAKKGILEFTVLVSRSIPLENSTMVSKALEREFSSFVRIISSLDSIHDSDDLESYLRKIHQNFDTSTSGEYFKDISFIANESFNPRTEIIKDMATLTNIHEIHTSLFESIGVEPEDINELDEEDTKTIVRSIRNDSSDKDCKVYKLKDSIFVKEADKFREIFIMNNQVYTTPDMSANITVEKVSPNKLQSDLVQELTESAKIPVDSFNRDCLNDKFNPNSTGIISRNKIIKNRFESLNEARFSINKVANNTDNLNMLRNDIVPKNQLADSEVKKSNELQPTLLHLRTFLTHKAGEDSLVAVDYVIGIKAMLNPIDSSSMIENLYRATKKEKIFVNMLKLTSGEISFFKDFVFAVNSIKQDVKIKHTDSKWWSTLERRKKVAKMLRTVNARNQLVPNSTIVISMEEVEVLKSKYNVDLMSVRTIKEIMDHYFLLSFVIVDTSIETVHIINDCDVSYQQYSFATLEKEASNQAREAKQIMQVLGRI